MVLPSTWSVKAACACFQITSNSHQNSAFNGLILSQHTIHATTKSFVLLKFVILLVWTVYFWGQNSTIFTKCQVYNKRIFINLGNFFTIMRFWVKRYNYLCCTVFSSKSVFLMAYHHNCYSNFCCKNALVLWCLEHFASGAHLIVLCLKHQTITYVCYLYTLYITDTQYVFHRW